LLIEGKLPPDLLEKCLSIVRKDDPRIVTGPQIGEDAALIDIGDKLLVIHSDPITGAVTRIGWYAVHIVANDIATRGARPIWFLPVVMLPLGWEDRVEEIFRDMRKAVDELDACIVGGHTEFTLGLNRPIISMTALGEVEKTKYVTTKNCRPGDDIILTKGVAIEGTSIIANELYDYLKDKVSGQVLQRAKALSEQISVVKDALIAINSGEVHSMHDPTEGGVANGLLELSLASGYGFVAYEESMIILPETEIILDVVKADPLTTISSGSLLIVSPAESTEEIIKNLEKEGIRASKIGKIVEDPSRRVIIRRDHRKMEVTDYIKEDLWSVLEKILKRI